MTIEVTATSTDGSTSSQSFAIGVTDTDEFDVGAITDTDNSTNEVAESVANGTAVGITAFAHDADGSDSVSYSLSDDAGGAFAIDAATGEVTVLDTSLLDFETSDTMTIEVTATSTDGSSSSQSFAIGITDTDEFDVGAITDTDNSTNEVAESVANGTAVGITAFASDADGGDSVSYSLSDDAGGAFAIDSTTGEVTVLDTSLLDFETSDTMTIEVTATSTDGSSSSQSFAIGVTDTDEFDVGAITDTDSASNEVAESVANGTAVGITAFAHDADGSDSVSYSLSDDAGGAFAIDAATGEVTVLDTSLLDFEASDTMTIEVTATSTDGSTSSQSFAIGVTDENEGVDLSVADQSGNEDSAIALNINLSNLEPGATHTVTITGVPSGASLSAGTDNGGGNWTLDASDVSGLTITPPEHSDANFDLSVSVTSEENGISVNTTTETFEVDVNAVADAPNLTVDNNATGIIDHSVKVDIPQTVLDEVDAGETLTISNMPRGSSLSEGIDNGDGSWTVQVDAVDNLFYTPPSGSTDAVKLGFTAEASDTQTLINENFDAGAGDFSYSDNTFRGARESNYADGNKASGESGTAINVELGGQDHSDINDMSGGWSTSFKVPEDASGKLTFSYKLDADSSYENNEYSEVLVGIDGSLVGTNGNDYVDRISGGGDSGWQTVTIDLGKLSAGEHKLTLGGYNNRKTQSSEETEIRFDNVELTVDGGTPVTEYAAVTPSEIALDISTSLVDTDGSETLAVSISGVPSGASLSAGTDEGGGVWSVDQADLPGLTIDPPDGFSGTFTLMVEAASTDGSDMATSTANIDVTVYGFAEAPTLKISDANGTSNVTTADFETGASSSGFESGSIDGWSPGSGNQIETWHENDVDGDAASGDMFIELNNESSGFYSDAGVLEKVVTTESNTPYELTFQASPREGFESYMDFEVNVIDESTGETLKTINIDWDGNSVSELNWQTYSVQFVGTGGDVLLQFNDTGAVHSYGRGAFIDDIQFGESDGYAAGEAIDMSSLISASADSGAETLTLEFEGLPENALLESGGASISIVDGVAELDSSDLAGLELTVPEGFNGDLHLNVTATATQDGTGTSSSINDSLSITIVSNDENMDDSGTAGSNTINGSSSSETLYAGTGDDTVNAGAGDDVVYGGSGDDTINGEDGDDVLFAGDGDDEVNGGEGSDFVYAGEGNDDVSGGAGNDFLYGGQGNDAIDGGDGNDMLIGGLGNDTLVGGEGDDMAIFNAFDGNDSFDGGAGGGWTDVIQLDASGDPNADPDNPWTIEVDGNVVDYDVADGALNLDPDSSGVITMEDGSQMAFQNVEQIQW